MTLRGESDPPFAIGTSEKGTSPYSPWLYSLALLRIDSAHLDERSKTEGLSRRHVEERETMTPTSALEMVIVHDDAHAALVAASRKGSIKAFTQLFEPLRESLYSLCKARLRDRSQAEDVVQETFLKGFTHFDRFDDGKPVWPWLATIAERSCIDVQRRSSRVTVLDDHNETLFDVRGFTKVRSDATLDAVLDAEHRERLGRALEILPDHQRRVLLLYALEGWSYPEIAQAEGLSLTAIKSSMWRARRFLRKKCDMGFGGLFAWGWGKSRQQGRQFKARARITAYRLQSSGAPAYSFQPISAGLLALAIGVSVAPVGSGIAIASVRASTAQEMERNTGSPGRGGEIRSLVGAPRKALTLHEMLLDPADGARPEDTQITSFASSSDDTSDGTPDVMFAAGVLPCSRVTCPVLFRSLDGGVTWTRLKAEGFTGQSVFLPSDAGSHPKIFAMGPAGLQESVDGGSHFTLRTPISGSAAISPRFSDGDPRILIGGSVITEYWADRSLTKPAAIPILSRDRSEVAFSSNSPVKDGMPFVPEDVVVVGSVQVGSDGPIFQSVIKRCAGPSCSEFPLPDSAGVPNVRLPGSFPRSGRAVAFTSHGLFSSSDGAKSFASIDLPPGVAGKLQDVQIVSRTTSDTLFIATSHRSEARPGGVYRSGDNGRTWTPLLIDLPGFQDGTGVLFVAPSGRIFAGAIGGGIACSEDGGDTWSSRCEIPD